MLATSPTSTNGMRFLDPGIGTGSFYTALLRAFPGERITAATGFEIDPHYGLPACEFWRDYPLEICLGDFTTATPPQPSEQVNLIVCNPPYVRHHHMDAVEKSRLQRATVAASGVRIGGLAGLYCYFMALSHAWLAEDGLAAWLVPSEFMDVNYGGALKNYLLNQVELLRIHRFAPDDLQFADALVSSAVVWYRKRRPRPGHVVEFTYGGTHANPTHKRSVPASALPLEAKWTRFPGADVRAASADLKLADFFKIQRGLANVYLMLYPRPILARALESDQGLARKVCTFLNEIDIQSLLGEGRVYGGGLYKMEPKELANVPANPIAALFAHEGILPSVSTQTSLWGADELLELHYSR